MSTGNEEEDCRNMEAGHDNDGTNTNNSGNVSPTGSPHTRLVRLEQTLAQTQKIISQMEKALRRFSAQRESSDTPGGEGEVLMLSIPTGSGSYGPFGRRRSKSEEKSIDECEAWLDNAEASLVNHILQVPGLLSLVQSLTAKSGDVSGLNNASFQSVSSPVTAYAAAAMPWLKSRRTLSAYSAVFAALACIQGLKRGLMRIRSRPNNRGNANGSSSNNTSTTGKKKHADAEGMGDRKLVSPQMLQTQQRAQDIEIMRQLTEREEHFLNDAVALQHLMLRDDSNLMADVDDTHFVTENEGHCFPTCPDTLTTERRDSAGENGNVVDDATEVNTTLNNDTFTESPPKRSTTLPIGIRRDAVGSPIIDTAAKTSRRPAKSVHPAWTDTQLVVLSLGRGESAAAAGQMAVAANDFALIVKLLFKKCYVVEELVMTAVAMSEQQAAKEAEEEKQRRRKSDAAAVERVEEAAAGAMLDPMTMMMMLPPGLEEEDYEEERSYFENVVGGNGSNNASNNNTFTHAYDAAGKARSHHEDHLAWIVQALSKVSPDALPLSTLQAHCHLDLSISDVIDNNPSVTSSITRRNTQRSMDSTSAGSVTQRGSRIVSPTGVEMGLMPSLKSSTTLPHNSLFRREGEDDDTSCVEDGCSKQPAQHPHQQQQQQQQEHRGGQQSHQHTPFSLSFLFARLLWNTSYTLWSDGYIEDALRWLLSIDVTRLGAVLQQYEAQSKAEQLRGSLRFSHSQRSALDPAEGADRDDNALCWESLLYKPGRLRVGGNKYSAVGLSPSEEELMNSSVPSIILPVDAGGSALLAADASLLMDPSASPTPPASSPDNSNVDGYNGSPTVAGKGPLMTPRPATHESRSHVCRRLMRRIIALRDLCLILQSCETTDDVLYLVRELGHAHRFREQQLESLEDALESRVMKNKEASASQKKGAPGVSIDQLLNDTQDGVAEVLVVLSIVVEFFLAKRARKMKEQYRVRQRHALAARLLQQREAQEGGAGAGLPVILPRSSDVEYQDDEQLENAMMRAACDELVRAFTAGSLQSVHELDQRGMPTSDTCSSASDGGPTLSPGLSTVLGTNVLSSTLNYVNLFRLSKIYRGVATTERRHPNDTRCGVSATATNMRPPSSNSSSQTAETKQNNTSGGLFDKLVGFFSGTDDTNNHHANNNNNNNNSFSAMKTESPRAVVNAADECRQQREPPRSAQQRITPLHDIASSHSGGGGGGGVAHSSSSQREGAATRLYLPSKRASDGLPLLAEESTVVPPTGSSDEDSLVPPTLPNANTGKSERYLRLLTIVHRAQFFHSLEAIRPSTLTTVTNELNKAMHLLQREMRYRFGTDWWAAWKAKKEASVHQFYKSALAEVRVADLQRCPPLTEALPRSRRMSPVASVLRPPSQRGIAAAAAVCDEVAPPSIPIVEKQPSAWWSQPLHHTSEVAMQEKRKRALMAPSAADVLCASPSSGAGDKKGGDASPTTADDVGVIWDAPPSFTPDVAVDFSAFTTTSIETQLATKQMLEDLMRRNDGGGGKLIHDSSTDMATENVHSGDDDNNNREYYYDDRLSLMSPAARQLLHDELPMLQQYSAWRIIYSTKLHGMSMQTLLSNCARENANYAVKRVGRASVFSPLACPMLLVMELSMSTGLCFASDDPGVRDAALSGDKSENNKLIIGAFLSDMLQMNSRRYYGSKETFLFQILLPGRKPSANAASSAASGSLLQEAARALRSASPQVRVFRSTGANTQFINCRLNSIIIGGGGGSGIYVHDSLQRGASTACPTFGSPQLTTWDADYSPKNNNTFAYTEGSSSATGGGSGPSSPTGSGAMTASFNITRLEVIVMDNA